MSEELSKWIENGKVYEPWPDGWARPFALGKVKHVEIIFRGDLNHRYWRYTTPDTINGEADPDGKLQHEPGAKLDAGKLMPWLCFSGFAHALEAVAEVTTVGARKYTPNGWERVENGEARYMEAYARHAIELGKGGKYDSDTKCLHKAQMIWNLLASLELELREKS